MNNIKTKPTIIKFLSVDSDKKYNLYMILKEMAKSIKITSFFHHSPRFKPWAMENGITPNGFKI